MASKTKQISRPKKLERITIGKRGEELAASFLVKNGFEILERNWRKKMGEIDIIAFKDGAYRIIEVKTRVSKRAGMALEAITDQKMYVMDQLAQRYLFEKHLRGSEYHLDVITIDVGEDRKATLRYLPDLQ